ncbi:hypothetical protein GCM10027610_087610 [Dactylosporangium cerinum]
MMGRGTYEPAMAVGITSPYRHMEQFVFSRTLADLDPGVTFVGGDTDPAAFVHDLKRRDGLDIWLCGGGQLAAQLVDEIDELVLKVNPMVIGAGVPLFAGPFRPTPFRRADTRTFDTGVSIVTYERVEAA